MHGFRCYDNIASNVKCQQVLVLALCLALILVKHLFGVWMQAVKLKFARGEVFLYVGGSGPI